MTDQGYIKLFRTIKEWGWYDDPSTLALWIHILVEANWKDSEWHGELIERGSFVTSLQKLVVETGLSTRQVRTCLDRLVASHEIVREATSKWTKITICKYDDYQSSPTGERQTNDTQTTNERQTNDKQTTTIEEIKKERIKESNSRFVKPTVEQIRTYCQERGYAVNADTFFDFYESKGWVVGKSPMKDWKAAIRTWVRKDGDAPARTTEKLIGPDDIFKMMND